MDCENFDRIVLDLLYGELDELTGAAARRHIEHCSRCKAICSGLRATREVGALQLVDPPEGLELGILEAERRINARLPFTKRLGRGVSILAVYAMRPQLAMAALLLLMIGSSLFFLRARPGASESVLVTERGIPETEAEHVAILPAPARRADSPSAPPPKGLSTKSDGAGRDRAEAKLDIKEESRESEASALTAVPEGDAPSAGVTADATDPLDAATAAFQGGRYVEAQRRFEEVAARGGPGSASAALQAVEALRRQRGCPAAAPRYEDVHARYRDTQVGSEAAWQAGDCYRALGELSRARQSFEALLEVAEYRSRAEAALGELIAREDALALRKAKGPTPGAAEAKPAAKPAAASAPKAGGSP